MDESGSQKIKIKIGGAEFEAEGPTELLKEQFARFMDVVEKLGERGPAPSVGVRTDTTITPPAGAVVMAGAPPVVDNSSNEAAAVQASPVVIGDDLISRTFRRDADSVSLLALPRSDDGGADALVLLLYGYQRLMNRGSVNGFTLIRAARQSGVQIARVDTTLAKRSDYVLSAGAKRGRVYSLNNRGVTYAEGVLRRTLE